MREDGLPQRDQEEEAEALEQVLGVDLAVGAEGALAAGQRVAGDDAAVGDRDGERPRAPGGRRRRRRSRRSRSARCRSPRPGR